jgi:hypothetical protein
VQASHSLANVRGQTGAFLNRLDQTRGGQLRERVSELKLGETFAP